jgi:hypothetical protein
MSPSRCDQDPADRRQQFAVPGRAQAPRDPIAMGTSRSTTIQQFLEGERPRELYALSRRICGCHPSSVGEKRLWVKNFFIFVLLVLAAWFGWKYFNPPVPVQIATAEAKPATVSTTKPIDVPFPIRVKIEKMVKKYESVLLKGGSQTLPERTREELFNDLIAIKKDLQWHKIYDENSLRKYLEAALATSDANADGRKDYAPEQIQYLVEGVLSFAAPDPDKATTWR